MKKINLKIFLINFLIYFVIAYLLVNSKVCVNSIKQSTDIFLNKLIPALLPFILITELLINFNIIQNLSYGMQNIICKIFKLNKNACAPVICGYLLGYPNAAKVISNMYSTGKISKLDAIHLITFTNNANMSYVLSSIGILIYYNIKVGIILLVSHFLSSIIIGICYGYTKPKTIIQQKNVISNTFSKSNFEIVINCILNTLKTFGIIFMYTVCFSLIPTILLNNLAISDGIKAFITGIFEISNGIYNISKLNIHINYKIIFTSFILSFSSFMVLFQVYSYVYSIGIKFKDLIKYKFIQGVLSSIITYILLQFIDIKEITTFKEVFNSYDNYITNTVILPSTIYFFAVIITLIVIYLSFNKNRK